VKERPDIEKARGHPNHTVYLVGCSNGSICQHGIIQSVGMAALLPRRRGYNGGATTEYYTYTGKAGSPFSLDTMNVESIPVLPNSFPSFTKPIAFCGFFSTGVGFTIYDMMEIGFQRFFAELCE